MTFLTYCMSSDYTLIITSLSKLDDRFINGMFVDCSNFVVLLLALHYSLLFYENYI